MPLLGGIDVVDRWIARLDTCPPELHMEKVGVAAKVVAGVSDLADALADVTDDPSAVLGHDVGDGVPPYTSLPGTNVGVAILVIRRNRSRSIVWYEIVGIRPSDPVEAVTV